MRLPALEKFVPSQRFAVEFDRRTVGIAVRVPGGFMFFSSTEQFEPLDGRVFKRARSIERQLKKVARTKPRNVRPAHAQLPAF